MITISPKRSAKCPAETWKPRTPNTKGPAKSIASARIQITAWAVPPTNAAAISISGAGSAVRARRTIAWPVSTSSFASAKMKMWSQRAAA